VEQKERHRRLRLLVGKLNKERKVQAKKIDILCNDFISAQRNFIKRLGAIGFAAGFYESIVGKTDLNELLNSAGKLIETEAFGAAITFVLRQTEGFKLHMLKSEKPISLQDRCLENCFTSELVDNICKSNKVCTLDDMFTMGLQGNPTILKRICAVTVPLGRAGSSIGFVLICRSAEEGLTVDELNNILAITPGLARAIKSCQALCHLCD